jgi:hypothetical protein
MAKSRMAAGVTGALAALLLGLPAPAAAQTALTADAAIARQREQLVEDARIGCRRTGGAEEIVVCGRGGVEREWIPAEAVEGERPRFLPGEPPSGTNALAATAERCSTVGLNQRCSGGLDVFRVGSVLFKLGKHLLNKDD